MDSNTTTCRVSIADGNADVRSALRCLVEQEDGFSVVAESGTFPALLRSLSCTTPDVLFLDAELSAGPQADGINLLGWDHPRLAIIILSSDPHPGKNIPPGACCVISKKDPPETVRRALKTAQDWCRAQ
jgi:DNA-binding NarL/FixJ family response regulator